MTKFVIDKSRMSSVGPTPTSSRVCTYSAARGNRAFPVVTDAVEKGLEEPSEQ